MNIARSPIAGRNFEYLSEDPYLNSSLVVPYIEGVQSQGVIATVKHYALNDQEYNRHNVRREVDERTMREIYLPSFEAAVTQAHVDAVMNSYNLVNGVHATQNEFLNLKVLKGDWGFQGILMSDWDATYDGVARPTTASIWRCPAPRFMNDHARRPPSRTARSRNPRSTTRCCACCAPCCATASSTARNSIRPTRHTPSPIAPLPWTARSRA